MKLDYVLFCIWNFLCEARCTAVCMVENVLQAQKLLVLGHKKWVWFIMYQVLVYSVCWWGGDCYGVTSVSRCVIHFSTGSNVAISMFHCYSTITSDVCGIHENVMLINLNFFLPPYHCVTDSISITSSHTLSVLASLVFRVDNLYKPELYRYLCWIWTKKCL